MRQTLARTMRLHAATALSLCGVRAVHPIHAARVELDASQQGVVHAIIHVYRDDFPPGQKPTEIDVYLDRVLIVTDVKGTRVSLHAISVEPDGDRLRVILAGTSQRSLGGGRVTLTLLQEKFADQVDVVDARTPGHRTQLVFLRGDGSQLLP